MLADDPLAFWPLQDRPGANTASDVSSNNLNAAYSGPISTVGDGPTAGTKAKRLSDQTTVTAPPDTRFNTLGGTSSDPKSFTIEVWVRSYASDPGRDAGILALGSGGCPSTEYSYDLQFDEQRRVVSEFSDGETATISPFDDGSVASDAAWHQVAETYNGAPGNSSVTLYLDGVDVGSDSVPHPAIRTEQMFIGSEPCIPFSAIDVADVSVFDHGLTADQIRNHFAAATCPSPGVSMGIGGLIRVEGCLAPAGGGGFTSTGPLRVNGVDVTPVAGAVVTVDPIAGTIDSPNVRVAVGPVELHKGPLSLDLSKVTAGLGVDQDGGKLFGLKISSASVTASVTGAGQFSLGATVALPEKFGGVTGTVVFTADNASGLHLDSLHISAKDFKVGGKLQVKSLDLLYTASGQVWKGSAEVVLPFRKGLDVSANATVARGDVTAFGASVDRLNVPIGDDGVFLQKIGFQVAYNPTSITGSAGITFGPQVAGKSAIRVDGSLTATLGDPFDVKASGTMKVLGVQLASAYADYLPTGRLTFGGQLDYSVGSFKVSASLDGWATGQAFNITGKGDIHAGSLHHSGNVVVSDVGIAACATLHFFGQTIDVGAGYRWGDTKPDIMSSSCQLGPYSATQAAHLDRPLRGDIVRRDGAAGPATTTVTIPSGLPLASFAVTGDTGIPDVTVTGPDGATTETTGTGAVGGPFYLVDDSDTDTVHVLVVQPADGTWTFTVNPGPALTSVRTADGLDTPSVTATVTGPTDTPTLSWTSDLAPGQGITFLEEGPQTTAVIATTSQASGSFAFAPADGTAAPRTVVAEITQDGLVRSTVPVASYTPPALNTLTLDTQSQDGGTGTLSITAPQQEQCTTHCSYSLPKATIVHLKATPDPGSRFTGWGPGPCSGVATTCTVKLTQAESVTARFAPRTTLPAPTVTVASHYPLTSTMPVTWSESAANPPITYDIRYRTATPSDPTLTPSARWLTGTTSTTDDFPLAPGSSVCFTAEARDSYGNVSPPSPPSCATTPIDDTTLTASGAWTTRTSASYYLGSESATNTAGATLTTAQPVTAKHLYLIASTGPNRGTITATLGNTMLGTVSLESPRRHDKVLIPIPVPPESATATLTLTANGPTAVDGLIVNPLSRGR